MRIYNTLSRSVEDLSPINPPHIGIYSCGPTVYDFQHIGHMRRYSGDDLLIRVLRANGFEVKHVMNITDVGHLVSDSDEGEDKMEKGAKKEGLSVWDLAKKFEQQFKDSCKSLNILLPKDLMHATEYIPEQIELIKKLEEKEFTYKTSDGLYFDTSKFPDYFLLSRQNPEELMGGIRVDLGEKRNITDFALWKFSRLDQKRQMEWDSPWGKGFPGWHIECSAMSMKALGESFDVHTGGIDHINIHHTNEIAQSEAVTGKQFAKYFVHHAFLTVEGQKMSKSLGNFFTVQDVINKGFDPLALRYLYLQTHYRQEMNFTWEALEGSQTALSKLRENFLSLEGEGDLIESYKDKFMDNLNDDLNTSKALSILWEMVKSDETGSSKRKTLLFMDEILGLGLSNYKVQELVVPQEVKVLVNNREDARKNGDFEKADMIRKEIEEKGYAIQDEQRGPRLKPLT